MAIRVNSSRAIEAKLFPLRLILCEPAISQQAD
jgi:hypothetical protein